MPTLAERQLAAWQAIAETWPTSIDWNDDGLRSVRRCDACGKGIMLSTDQAGALYMYTDEQWLALVVLHLRNHHAGLDPDR